ncbi:thymidine kinase [Bacillus mojavensis]
MRDSGVKELNLGTMRSAKSAQLIMKGYSLDEQGKKVLTFKPEMDTRDGTFVVSRALPIKRPATIVPQESDGSIMSSMTWAENPDVILIDELQFFTIPQVEKLAEISLTYDVDIFAYGLMLSYNGKMFEPIRRALECGFKMKTIDMSCDHCNNDATHHTLYIDGVLQVDGDAINVENTKDKTQVYESVCYSCFQRAIDVYEMNKIDHTSKK